MLGSSSCDCYTKLKELGIPFCLKDFDETNGEDDLEGEGIKLEKVVDRIGMIRINEYIREYPIVDETELSSVFQIMSRVVYYLSDFELNLLSFWILDVFIEGLQTAQQAGMDHDQQLLTLLWIAYMFNYIQLNNVSRREVFKALRSLLLIPPEETYISGGELFDDGDEEEEDSDWAAGIKDDTLTNTQDEEEGEDEGEDVEAPLPLQGIWVIPRPPVLGLSQDGDDYEYEDEFRRLRTASSAYTTSSGTTSEGEYGEGGFWMTRSRELAISRANVEHMKTILEILYRIFGRFYAFKQLRMSIYETPNVQVIDLPFAVQVPKLLQPYKPITPPTSAPTKGKSKKGKALTPPPTAEQIAEQMKHKNDFILPLQLAEGTKMYVRRLFGIPSNESILKAMAKKKKGKK